MYGSTILSGNVILQYHFGNHTEYPTDLYVSVLVWCTWKAQIALTTTLFGSVSLDSQINTQTVSTFPDIAIYGSSILFGNLILLVILLRCNGYYISGHIGVICLTSWNCTRKQSKTHSPLGPPPDNIMFYRILLTYGIGAFCPSLFSIKFFLIYFFCVRIHLLFLCFILCCSCFVRWSETAVSYTHLTLPTKA